MFELTQQKTDCYLAEPCGDYYFDFVSYDVNHICPTIKFIQSLSDMEQWIDSFPKLKQTMDIHFEKRIHFQGNKHRKWDQFIRESQQVIIRENNFIPDYHITDFIICDQDYESTLTKKRKFNLVAAQLTNTSQSYINNVNRRLVIIELIYGYDSTSYSKKLKTRVENAIDLLNDPKICNPLKDEMRENFNQKRNLGIIDSFHRLDSFSEQSPILIVAPINHKPRSDNLRKFLNHILKYSFDNNSTIEIFVAKSSLMGYGLYNDSILPIQEALKSLNTNL